MSIDWFRSWHGAPTDNKWLLIGRKAGVAPGIVSAVAWALMDYASQNDQRGSIEGFDVETYSAFSGFDEVHIEAIITALTDKGMISDNRLVAWEKRQPNREDDTAAERKRKQREREKPAPSDDVSHNVTQCHEMSRLDKDTDTESKKEARVSKMPLAVSARPHPVATPGSTGVEPPTFDDFWKAFPRKTGIGTARAAFSNQLMFHNADPVQIVNAAKAFARKHDEAKTEERFIPKPESFLNSQTYLDPDLQGSGSFIPC